MILAVMVAVVMVSSLPFLQSCGNNELELNAKKDIPLTSKKSFSEITPENKEFKSLLLDTKNIVKLKRNVNSGDRKNAPSKATEAALNQQMQELTIASMKMLKSYGIEYKDIAQYVDNANDPRIASMGMIFVALQKTGKTTSLVTNVTGLQKNKRFKVDLPEGDSVFPYGKVVDCASRTIIGVSASDFLTGQALGYFTLETALGIAGRCASRTFGVFGAAIAIADFGDCMGWYDLW